MDDQPPDKREQNSRELFATAPRYRDEPAEGGDQDLVNCYIVGGRPLRRTNQRTRNDPSGKTSDCRISLHRRLRIFLINRETRTRTGREPLVSMVFPNMLKQDELWVNLPFLDSCDHFWDSAKHFRDTAKPESPFCSRYDSRLAQTFAGVRTSFPMPRLLPVGFVTPCQPTSVPVPPIGADWLHEIKHDGYRLMVLRAGARLRRGDGPALFAQACAMGLEGIVSKRRSSPYRSGRSPHWLKAKNPESPAARREAFEDWGRNRRSSR